LHDTAKAGQEHHPEGEAAVAEVLVLKPDSTSACRFRLAPRAVRANGGSRREADVRWSPLVTIADLAPEPDQRMLSFLAVEAGASVKIGWEVRWNSRN